jgi:hypothetical protein
MSYSRCFQQGRTFAYVSASRCDHAFVFVVADNTFPADSLDGNSLIQYWSAAAKVNGVQQRAVYFFPTIAQAQAAAFVQTAMARAKWNCFTYWSTPDPSGGPRYFPTGESVPVALQQMSLTLKAGGQMIPLTDLSTMDFTWDNSGKLAAKSREGQWTVFNNNSPDIVFGAGQTYYVELDHPDSAVLSGAIEVPVLADQIKELPFKVAYSTAAKVDDAALDIEEALAARVVSALSPTPEHSFIALDPRDYSQTTFNDRSQRSRLEFAAAIPFTSYLQTERGQAVMLQVTNAGVRGRGELRYDVTGGAIDGAGWSLDPGDIGFMPHGDFIFIGVEGKTGVDRSQPSHRILTGSTATEFIDLPLDGILRFDSTGPGVLRGGDKDAPPPGPPPAADAAVVAAPGGAVKPVSVDDLFHNGAGYITTSWLTALHPDAKTPAQFHTQPERSPLFGNQTAQVTADTDSPPPLSRKAMPYGGVSKRIPFFPFAGKAAAKPVVADENDSVPTPPDYEHTHFAIARRIVVDRKSGAPGGGAALAADVAPDLGVTPQGIISTVAGTDFTELRFGEPSTVPPSPSGTEPPLPWPLEYKIALKAPAAGASQNAQDAYEEFQRALRGNDLFAVFRNMSAEVAACISPATDLQLRQFRLSLDITVSGSSVLIIKYFKNRSLSDLLPNTDFWAAKAYLAPNTSWDHDLKPLVYTDKVIPEPLNSIWQDPNWQGILILNLAPAGLPDIFEALKAGMVFKNLRFHHFGLNYLPVKANDLKQGQPRLGSAFGLLLYKKDRDPNTPSVGDHNPNGSSNDGVNYGFVVNSLETRFANSQVTSFQAEVDVKFSRLFWDNVSGNSTAVVTLLGGYEVRQTTTGGTADVFSLKTTNQQKITFGSSCLSEFDLQRAEFTVTSTTADRIVSFIGFSGELKFGEAASFPLFKVDSIVVERLGLELNAARGNDPAFSCKFRADSIRANVSFGNLEQSLLSLLPLKFLGFRVAIDKLLDMRAMGYLPLGGELGGANFHFAFDLELDLGFFGKLSGGSGLKLPLMLGWKSGGGLGNLGLGISFPNWNGNSFEIGIESFIAIRADSATIKRCKAGDQLQAIAIVLHNARLVFLGYEWPRDSQIDLALFVPAGGGRKMSWALARTADGTWLEYIAAGHRIQPPGADNPSDSPTKTLVENFQKILRNVGDACSLLPQQANNNNWIIVSHFTISKLVDIWLAACDDPALYGLRLELLSSGFTADALYRQLTDRLGVFSAEVTLPDYLRTYQVGAATIRLPVFGLSVYTDGGFLVDFGYPWNLDFSRSFQLEIVIFLGSGGFWFAYTSAAASALLALDADFNGFQPLKDNHLAQLDQFQAISAAMAMRAGIGRSFELGILKGEASLTVFSTLEGAVAYKKGDPNRSPKLFGIRGTMGIMLHISVEVNFVVLRAKAEFCAYVLIGFELRRVLALKNDGDNRGYYYLTMPIKVFAEVGIYVHVEVWVTIGCVRVKLFDLTFRGTWHYEENLGGFSTEFFGPLPATPAAVALADDAGPTLSDRALAASKPPLTAPVPFQWDPNYLLFATGESLSLYASLLPCAGNPADAGGQGDRLQPCVVTQLMLQIDTDFLKLAKFMAGWALQVAPGTNPTIMRDAVIGRRRELQANDYWLGGDTAKNVPLAALERQFSVTFTVLTPATPAANYAALPGWPDFAWRFITDSTGNPQSPTQPAVTARKMKVDGAADPVEGSRCSITDYLRALTDSVLSEFDRTIRNATDQKTTSLELASMTWDDLWSKFTAPSP